MEFDLEDFEYDTTKEKVIFVYVDNESNEIKDKSNAKIVVYRDILFIVNMDNGILVKYKDYRYPIAMYKSIRNINHTFRSRVLNHQDIEEFRGEKTEQIRSRIISTSRNTRLPNYDSSQSWEKMNRRKLHKDSKVVTHRNTDMGDTDNISRMELPKLGHPFRRSINYQMVKNSKDRLYYRTEAKELHCYNKDGERKKLLDDTFCSRVFHLYYRFTKRPNNRHELSRAKQKIKIISGHQVLDILKYLYQAMKSYNPFFTKKNGLQKYNIEWIKEIISLIEREADLSKPYKLKNVKRYKNVDKTSIDNKDVKRFIQKRKEMLNKGDFSFTTNNSKEHIMDMNEEEILESYLNS